MSEFKFQSYLANVANVASASPTHRTVTVASKLWATLVLSCCSGGVHAYLDPGTGSILVQGLIAGIAAALGYAGMYWQRVKDLFKSVFRPSQAHKTLSGEPDNHSH